MAYTNNKIVAPVGIADIQKAVGYGSGDLGRLCRYGNINMWAKYKPVINAMRDTKMQLKPDLTWKNINGTGGLGNDAWFKGTAGNYGITPASVGQTGGADNNRMITALNAIAKKINGNLNGWSYARPTGGHSSIYRIFDFIGYNADAVKPVKTATAIESLIYVVPASGSQSGSTWSVEYQIMGSADAAHVTDIDSRDYLLASDIIGTCYLGTAIFRAETGSLGNVTYYAMGWATGTSWQGEGLGDGSVNAYENYVEARLADSVDYYALPVFFSESLPQEQSVQSGVLPYPNHSKQPSTNFKVWTIPYTTFIPFRLAVGTTGQSYGIPSISNHSMGMLSWAGNIYLDRETNPSYYNAEGNGIVIQYALVNELWNGSYYTNTWASGSYTGLTSVTKDISGHQNIMIAENKNIVVSGNHTWKMVIIVAGEGATITLRQYNPPSA